jgi:hypothetical protein
MSSTKEKAMERSEVSIVFEPVDGDLFRPVRIEEEVEGHLRRARDDLGGIVIEAASTEGEALYRIHVATDDDVAGHVQGATTTYVVRPPGERGDRH